MKRRGNRYETWRTLFILLRWGGPLLLFWAAGPVSAAPSVATALAQLEVKHAAGGSLDLASLRGKPAVIYVWGNWCRSCARSTPEMLTLAGKYPAVRFIFINTDDPAAPARSEGLINVIDTRVDRAFFGDQVMRDKAFRFSQLGLVFGIPAYFLLDAEGRVRVSGNGSRYVPTLDEQLSALLSQ